MKSQWDSLSHARNLTTDSWQIQMRMNCPKPVPAVIIFTDWTPCRPWKTWRDKQPKILLPSGKTSFSLIIVVIVIDKKIFFKKKRVCNTKERKPNSKTCYFHLQVTHLLCCQGLSFKCLVRHERLQWERERERERDFNKRETSSSSSSWSLYRTSCDFFSVQSMFFSLAPVSQAKPMVDEACTEEICLPLIS